MTENKPPKIGGLLLAAGGSTRFGSPKQLAEFEGESLIRRAAKALIDAGCAPVTVVLGGEIEQSSKQLTGLDVNIAINIKWEKGMSSSIKTGLKALESSTPDLAAVLISLCDQPLITSEHLRRFTASFKQNRSAIIAADYGNFQGVPALFSRERFPDLYDLAGDNGAREVIRSEKSLTTIPLGHIDADVDEPGHLARIIKGFSE